MSEFGAHSEIGKLRKVIVHLNADTRPR